MTKITHKGLWFKYSSLSEEDKKTSKKIFLSSILCGFMLGVSLDKSALIMWSEIIHPSMFYIMPALTLIFGYFSIKYSYELYKNQDELYRKFHDFSLMAGFLGFAVFGLILHFVSMYIEYQPEFIDYALCSILGMGIGQVYFYNKFYE
jgi:hypothetical protein